MATSHGDDGGVPGPPGPATPDHQCQSAGLSFWHTMILSLLFCYLVTIPKHINDMEDIVVTPNLMCYL